LAHFLLPRKPTVPPRLDDLNPDVLRAWLTTTDPSELALLWKRADDLRRERVGDAVHLRGLIEISNNCVRQCLYCGIRACAEGITRYRMTADEILECARDAARLGYGTVVIQSGEDPELTLEFIRDVVVRIKAETGLAITLSLGERSDDELRAWKIAGADRYLLRFETSDPVLYRKIHPSLPGTVSDRFAQLERMRWFGYEIGTGVMVGIPGQTWDTLANDIWMFRNYDMDMIGIGPFLPSPRTPLGGAAAEKLAAPAGEQVLNDELTTLKAVALTRLVCPDANIPSTTALATIDRDQGRELGLTRGANIVMPNVSPPRFRVLYEIYPGKACIQETAEMCQSCLEGRIRSIGRYIGKGPGGRGAARDGQGPGTGGHRPRILPIIL
jgi:biotin synthase